jgi:hypothetical protein
MPAIEDAKARRGLAPAERPRCERDAISAERDAASTERDVMMVARDPVARCDRRRIGETHCVAGHIGFEL